MLSDWFFVCLLIQLRGLCGNLQLSFGFTHCFFAVLSVLTSCPLGICYEAHTCLGRLCSLFYHHEISFFIPGNTSCIKTVLCAISTATWVCFCWTFCSFGCTSHHFASIYSCLYISSVFLQVSMTLDIALFWNLTIFTYFFFSFSSV